MIEDTYDGLRIVFERSDDGGYTATVPELPGCISEGDTLDEARRNIREAIALYDYSGSVARAVRREARSQSADVVFCWEFPAEDFAAWLDLIGPAAAVATYAEYLALLDFVERDLARDGRPVRRLRFGVARMRDELERRRWPNTPDRRAAVLALIGQET